MRRSNLFIAPLFCMFLVACDSPVETDDKAGPTGELNALTADYWDYYLREYPAAATGQGINDFNDRLGSVDAEARARRYQARLEFVDRLQAIDYGALSVQSQLDADLLAWELQNAIEYEELGLYRIPFNTFWGFYVNALNASSSVVMRSREDYEDYLARMRDIPRYFEEHLANMRLGSDEGFVLPQIVIDGVLPTIEAQVKADPEDSSFYAPFVAMNEALSESEQDALRAEARNVIANAVMPAYDNVASFLRDDYQASQRLGAEQQPNGEAFYAHQIRRYTTLTETTADEIHATGLAEVARIRREMETLIAELNFDGSFDEFTEFLLNDPQFFAETPLELLQFAAYTAKRVDYMMPAYFNKLPRQSYGVIPVPEELAPNYTSGAYYGAPLGGKNGGAYWVNTFALDQRPLYEIPALTLHEAVPGHHHSNALALELENVPAFRRSLGYSAFGEGWALYTEKLGVEMGVYQTPYEHFGRLSFEMWRACRLVIDTGLHSQNWTRQQAIDYLMSNTALAAANARAEIDRYISWPGQALAYKLGELKVWELRRYAEDELGDDFDLRVFHDTVLSQGEVPLAMLEAVVKRWVEDVRDGN
ncbi:MAG: DUF885 domain-containing protein [Pseudomonadota bacterium]